jgi:predicted DNA-binding mobile mystery protein A
LFTIILLNKRICLNILCKLNVFVYFCGVMRDKRRLIIEQMDAKLQPFVPLKNATNPTRGWIHSIRTSLNMTLAQLGKRLSMTQQGAKKIEEREAEGGITINTLKEAAAAMDMQLVYGFVPRDGSLEALINKRAKALATEIIASTHHNMVLENQAVYGNNLTDPITKMARNLAQEVPKGLWD